MAFDALPQDTPLIMRFAATCGSDDLYATKAPIFLCDSTSNAKVVLLHCVRKDTFIIRSADDGQELIVGANGGCYFESPLLGISEEFKVEPVANGSVVFVSCRTGNVLESDGIGRLRCVDTLRVGWFLLQQGGTSSNGKAVVEAEETMPVLDPPCGHCTDYETKERREYIMKLVSLGKSLDEIDAILLRMYA
ncbi:MutS protein 1 [Phytophthora oleae]|uniref:MutS protein 1 n=1 Tax=Phytophthora oleae TaxID=2107226 RepID=A0ABD3FIT6_9STRA